MSGAQTKDDSASTGTVTFTLSTSCRRDCPYEVQASFDSNFQSGVQTTTFSTPPAASVSRISISNVTQTGATATVTIANPDGQDGLLAP